MTASLGAVAGLYRHPIKGFTPERLDRAALAAGAYFPCDRLYAVEDGPCGFDSSRPAHVSRQRFTVLAKIAEVANAHTCYDESTGVLTVQAQGREGFVGDLTLESGREAFAVWLTAFLGEAAAGPLRVLPAPQGHRFMDHPRGFVSVINLASVRDLQQRLGRPVDPRRFRGNLLVEGWPAWIENDLVGRSVRLGEGLATVFKPIVRCAATEVDPDSGRRDIDMTRALFDAYGHVFCGVYVEITRGCDLRTGDEVELLAA